MTKTATHHTETRLPHLAFAPLRAILLAEAKEHGLTATDTAADGLRIVTCYGDYVFRTNATGLHARIEAPRADWLFALKDGLTERITELSPDTGRDMRWSGGDEAGVRPPNFQLIEIREIAPLGRDFLRITATSEDLTRFGTDAIHFRLILPPEGLETPEWPSIAPNGATVWPSGHKALHRPVYTLRHVDPAAGTFTFDLFRHEGGRATEWAGKVRPGTVVGLTGPGGGGLVETSAITLYADETGFPAVARIVESLPQNATGIAVLSAGAGADCGYPMPTHPGIEIHWTPGRIDLAARAIAERKDHPNHFLWFAGEQRQARTLRDWCRSTDLDVRAHSIAAYWTDRRDA
ncbi:siderophore-interacting protein [Lutimaribacter marinistellae]|uniref:Siderophore-interacting protein n=1 Tax=Lutimaribacter marinistellae TaxID=1820329 RepID=A0ABV7TH05_9RHOB